MCFSADVVCMDTCLLPDQRRGGGGEEEDLRASEQIRHLPSACWWLLTKNVFTLHVYLHPPKSIFISGSFQVATAWNAAVRFIGTNDFF